MFPPILELGVRLLAPPMCIACDVPLALFRAAAFCVTCAGTTLAPAAQGGDWTAALSYGGAVQRALTRYKYEERADLASVLAALVLRQRARLVAVGAEVVVPVPLHRRRLVERGYNQAALLARLVARSLGVPLAARALERTRDTAHQVALGAAERARNVESAFRVRQPGCVDGKRVLLVDDVRTTGATLAACGRALRAAGAPLVHGVVVATRETRVERF